jgi:hypothetical protein
VSVGIQPIISDCDLALIGDMRGEASDKLQVIHPLHLLGLLPIPVADLEWKSSYKRLMGVDVNARAGGSSPKLLESLAKTQLLNIGGWLRNPLTGYQTPDLLEILEDYLAGP